MCKMPAISAIKRVSWNIISAILIGAIYGNFQLIIPLIL